MPSRSRPAAAGHTSLSALRDKQILAYLAARDVLRRIRRSSALLAPAACERVPASTQPRREGT